MIIDNTYFIGELYLPHAKPSITDGVTGVDTKVLRFIDEYEEDCLIKILGYNLYVLLQAELDSAQPNKLDPGADAKWNDLVNGKTYVDPYTNKNVIWKGLRYKSVSNNTYDRSLLANYVYYYYEQNEYITTTNVGDVINIAKNAITMDPSLKTVNAWNRFVDMVQGEEDEENVVMTHYGLGLDYYRGDGRVSLYKFIEDSNTITNDTYPDFNPKTWRRVNQFGI